MPFADLLCVFWCIHLVRGILFGVLQDNPTGQLHNELWYYNATDSTIRSLCSCYSPPGILYACLSVVPPPVGNPHH